MRFPPLRLFAAASLALLAACHDATAPETGSHFAAAVTGAETRTLTGEAAGGQSVYDANTKWYVMLMVDTTRPPAMLQFTHVGGSVARGTYGMGTVQTESTPTQFVGELIVGPEYSIENTYVSTGGTLTIEQLSSTRLRGRFDVQMATSIPGAPTQKTVHVVGTFDGPADVNMSGSVNVSAAPRAKPVVR